MIESLPYVTTYKVRILAAFEAKSSIFWLSNGPGQRQTSSPDLFSRFAFAISHMTMGTPIKL
jgi:hypothetical protein